MGLLSLSPPQNFNLSAIQYSDSFWAILLCQAALKLSFSHLILFMNIPR